MKIRRLVIVTFTTAACSLSLFPALAHAELQTVDFDSAPPALGAPLDARGDVAFPLEEGFRPYRAEVGARAHSGTVVGDVGRCSEEVDARSGSPIGCEFFQAGTTALLSRTGTSVTVFAGRFGPVSPFETPEEAVLTAFDSNGARLTSSGLVPVDAAGFDARLSVSDPAGRIARFTVRAVLASGDVVAGDLGIDDVTVNFTGGGTPDFSLSAPQDVFALVAGQSLEVPVRIARLNGSNGPVELSVSGLPGGVSAEPVTVPGGQTTASLVLTASPTAPDTDFTPTAATITADPRGDVNAGPGPRSAPLLVRVARDFELELNGVSETDRLSTVRVQVPDCAPLELPVKVRRDIAMKRPITLSLHRAGETGLPAGLSAEFLPSPVVQPGGGLVAERTLRIVRDPARVAGFTNLVLAARTDPNGPARELPVGLLRADPKPSIVQANSGSGRGMTPRLGGNGTRIRLAGAGFCPGTTVEVGNEEATVPATLLDPTRIEFSVPRYATTGRITVVPPANLPKYSTREILTVDSVRNRAGFPFGNYPFGSLSLSEFTKAFGADDLFIKINPCWPFGNCPVQTGFLSPIAAIQWGLMSAMPNRHCFGMALAAQHLASGEERYRAYADAGRGKATSAFEMSTLEGPGDFLDSLLDAEQVRQLSGEFLAARVKREDSLLAQLDLLEREFERNRKPIVNLFGEDGGHSVLAYDLVQTGDAAEIHVYDPNLPFLSNEESLGSFHRAQIENSVIHVDKVKRTWRTVPVALREEERGGDGSLWVTPHGTIPKNPSLPGLGTLKDALTSIVFDGGSVRAKGDRASVFVPVLAGSSSTDAGTLVGRDPRRHLAVEFAGAERGRYSFSYAGPGFVAAATDVATAEGVRDTVTGAGETLTIESGRARDLEIDLAKRSSGALTTAATIETRASAGGTDSAGFAAGALTYAHRGAPTEVEFTLTSVRRDGGPATLASGPVALASGDRLRAEPLGRDLERVRLTVRDARGRESTRVLRSHARPRGRLELAAAKVSGRRLTMRVRLAGMSGRAILGTSLRLFHDGRLLARKVVALKRGGRSRRVVWRLPRSLRDGRYRLLADARAVTTTERGATAANSVSAGRAGWLWVGE
jgi:hypothetical protein